MDHCSNCIKEFSNDHNKKPHELKCTKKLNLNVKVVHIFRTVTMLKNKVKDVVLNKQKISLNVKCVLNILLPSLVCRDIPITVMVKFNAEIVRRYFHLNCIWNIILKHVSIFWYVMFAA